MDFADLLSAIVADGHVAVPLSRLSEATSATPRQIRDAGRDLVKRGLIEFWYECPDGPAVCLTPATVDQLGLEPNDAGTRWVPQGSRRRPDRLPASRHAVRECDIDLNGVSVFDLVADTKALDPHQAASRNEALRIAYQAAEEAVACDPKWSNYRTNAVNEVRFKVPQQVVGISPVWPVDHIPGERCACCHHIKGAFVCIVCNSSSVDFLIGPPPSQATLDRQAGRYVAKDAKGRKLRGGVGKAKAAG